MAQSPYPLDGVTVLDLGQIYNGPYATFLMAMAGADVIKVEPRGGEHLRRRGAVGGAALPFAMLNSNKRSIVAQPQDRARPRAAARAWSTRADVLVENFAPGVMDRLGLGVDALRAVNPRLIYAPSSGYGQTGPYRDYPAMDLTVQAMSGVMSITGFPDRPPVKAGPALVRLLRRRASLRRDRHRAVRARAHRRGPRRRSRRCWRRSTRRSPRTSACYFGSGWRGAAAHRQPPRRPGRGALQRLSDQRRLHRDHLRRRSALEDRCSRRWSATDLPTIRASRSLKTRVAHMDEVDEIVGDFTSALRHAGPVRAAAEAPRALRAGARRSTEVVNDPHLHAARHAANGSSTRSSAASSCRRSPMRFDGATPLPHRAEPRLGARQRRPCSATGSACREAKSTQLEREEGDLMRGTVRHRRHRPHRLRQAAGAQHRSR